MAASPKDILRQIELQEPAIVRAFLESVREIVGDAKVAQIEALIASGQFAQIAVVLGVNAAAFSTMLEAVRTAYVRGGVYETGQVSRGGTFRLRFDVRNARAEAWLRDHSSRLVTEIVEDQRQAIQLAAAEGTRTGRNPRQTALDIVGRISPQTGRRSGGIVGLTSQQAQYVANARAQLLSGDPEQMRAYLQRGRRDARFDGLVRRAIAASKPVAVADVDRIMARYADRLLLLRGETIARTEALSAFSAGREETYAQAIDQGIRAENVTKTWRTAADGRVRDAHAAMRGQKRAFGEPFRSPTGALLMHPGDSSLGAGGSDLANCRCVHVIRIDQIAEALGG